MRRLYRFGLVPLALAWATVAHGQEQAAPSAVEEASTIPVDGPVANAVAPAEEAKGSRLIDEIVVTAQKREENLQDVPISVAAFSGGQLEALGVDNARDLGSITPGFVGNENLGFSLYSIRGVGSDIFVPSADTGVATYIDGIYQPLPNGLSTDFGRLERVEVLKGPQGTLYGRNTVGGAVNIITRKPSDAFDASLRAERGSFDSTRLKGYVSGPLIAEHLFAGISVIRNTSHTFYDPIPESVVQHFDDDVMTGVNPRVRWQIADTLDLTVSAMITKMKGPSPLLGTLDAPSPMVIATGAAKQGDYEVSRNSIEDEWTNRNKLYYLESNWEPEALNVKLLASKQRQRQTQPSGAFDFDQTEKPIASADQNPQLGDVTTVELQFSSKSGGWLGDDFVWTTGVYYFDSKTGIDPIHLSLLGAESGSPVDAVPLLVGPPLSDVLQTIPGLLGPATDGLPPLTLPLLGGVVLVSHGVVDTDAIAGYGQLTWNPTDWLGVTLGGRYQVEDRGTTKAHTSLSNADGSETRVFNWPLDKVRTKRFSPKVGLDLRPFGDDTLLYASYQEATKSGTFNTINFTAAPSEVKPQDVEAVEIGLKGTLFDGALRYDVAAYRYDIKNFQAQYVSLLSGGALNLYNAKKARSEGLEANALWQVFPEWDPGFVLNVGVASIRAKFKDFENGSGFDKMTGLFFGERAVAGSLAPPRDFTGHRMPSSPRFTGVLGLNQTLDLPGGSLELGVNVSHSAAYYYNAQNTDEAQQPRYTLLGARISYLYEPWNVRLTVSGLNLTDEVYYRSRFTSDFGTASQIAPPRIIAVSLAWEFQ